jgi:hypothetical protein
MKSRNEFKKRKFHLHPADMSSFSIWYVLIFNYNIDYFSRLCTTCTPCIVNIIYDPSVVRDISGINVNLCNGEYIPLALH